MYCTLACRDSTGIEVIFNITRMKKREIYFNARYHPAVGVFRQRHDARRVTFERLMCVEIADRSASYINNIRWRLPVS
jgi:hypothetical protein